MPSEVADQAARLQLEGLVKSFAADRAVDDVTLDIAAGEFMTFLGPSGSGKTTTLNMIAGFLQPSAGRILLGERDISGVPPHRRGIGMVFQNYALFPHMTVEQNVAYPLKQRKVPKDTRRRRVSDALALVELERLAQRRPGQLSGGQQQRVALARALVFNPPVLLMDEPLGALDKRLRDTLQLEIKRVHEQLKITFVYVTHDQEEALLLSDRIAVFNHGRIEQVATPQELYERPRTRFVAEFLGDSNVFRGVVADGGAALRLDDGVELAVDGTSRLQPGAPAIVVVRPERTWVRPIPRGEAAPAANSVSGVVAAVRYMGSARKVEVASKPGGKIVAREPADRLSGAEPGDEVEVCWSPDDCVVIADEQAAGGAAFPAAPSIQTSGP